MVHTLTSYSNLLLLFTHLPGGLPEGEATVIRGSASADVKPGGAAATSALSLRSSSVHNTAAMGLEFMCCLNLKQKIAQILKLATPLSGNYYSPVILSELGLGLYGNHLCFSLITLYSISLQINIWVQTEYKYSTLYISLTKALPIITAIYTIMHSKKKKYVKYGIVAIVSSNLLPSRYVCMLEIKN